MERGVVGTRSTFGPLREVVHIEEGEGARGGKYWWVTLECGHHKGIQQRYTKSPERLFGVLTSGRVTLDQLMCPKRARCLFCPGGIAA